MITSVYPDKRDNFSYKRFGSPTRDSSRRGECPVVDFGFKAEIRIKEVEINSAKHTVIG